MNVLIRAIRIYGIVFIFLAQGTAGIAGVDATTQPIDRQALVTRHNIEVHDLDPMGSMAVGNGEFAFNFDVTGPAEFPASITRKPCR